MRLPELPLTSSRNRIGPLRPPRTAPTAARLTEWQDFGPNPGALKMFFHVPEGLPKAAPLVVILHGCGQTATGYDQGTGWSALGESLGFAVLAPEQQNANNMGGCFNWFQPGDTERDSGEAASIRQMIAMTGAHDLDSKRIYITGLSAGGAMTAAMLAAYPELFAGGAIIAGLAYSAAANVPEALNSMRRAPQRTNAQWAASVRNASSHKGPWPRLSVWHGDADATVHVSNAEALIGQWRGLQGLAQNPSRTETGLTHVRQSWHGADGSVLLESIIIAGLAHGVPIDAEIAGHAGPFFLEAGLSSTHAIAEFWGLKQPEAAVKAVPSAKAPKRLAPVKVIIPDIVAALVEKTLQQTVVMPLTDYKKNDHKQTDAGQTGNKIMKWPGALVRVLKKAGLAR